MLKYIRDYIFPSTCLSCATPVLDNNKFCSICWYQLDFIAKPYCEICGRKFEISSLEGFTCSRCMQDPPTYDKARFLLKFDVHSKKIIHKFKYQDKLEIADTFANMIYDRYTVDFLNIDLVVPVPMNRFKRLFRMYNQTEILAKKIAKISNKQLYLDLLIKNKWTKSQTFLSKEARKNNIIGTIKINNKYNVKNRNILLIDDVLTTGTTVKYCSSIIRRAGAATIFVLAIAAT
ncbi:MAG: ComF family protein [Rickettsiaceae bacterium]|nr:MAG: ComF family protein [Rickettsiaceae bacterium]